MIAELAKVPEFFFALVLMLGVVITVHEFGHFIVAKLCGVRVLKFSIGFGPPIGFGRFRLAWHRGGTDYVIAWFPLGGFVKMLGETPTDADSDEAQAHVDETLGGKPLWQKLAIILAGPAMNLLLPVVVFVGSLAVGIDRQDAVVGTVERGSPAQAAGVRAGDRVLAVDGSPVRWWDDVEEAVRAQPGAHLELELERSGEPYRVGLDVVERRGLDVFRAASGVGWVGLQHPRQQAVVGIRDSGSRAGQAGLLSGDRVTAVNGTPVADWGELAASFAAARGDVLLSIARGPAEAAETLELRLPAEADLEQLGMIPAVVMVSEVEPGSAAGDAGVKAGDVIVAVDGRPIGSFFSFQETVFASEGRTLEIRIARDGRTLPMSIAPRLMNTKIGGGDEEVYRIGIVGENAILIGAVALDREPNPLRALPRAVAMTEEITRLFLRGLKKIVLGEISRKNVGGPIEIAKQSHLALQAGWDMFLRLLVLISINVGILNLLPIPILDGGQAMMFLVEGVKRSPLSLRTREMVQQVGLVFLMLIMGMAFWNDISRHWSSFVDWVRGL